MAVLLVNTWDTSPSPSPPDMLRRTSVDFSGSGIGVGAASPSPGLCVGTPANEPEKSGGDWAEAELRAVAREIARIAKDFAAERRERSFIRALRLRRRFL